MNPPICPYCKKAAKLVTGAEMYPHRSDLAGKRLYICKPCDARVGCHPGTERPLGDLANAPLREARMAAHDAFDQVWKSGRMKRSQAYGWLSTWLGLTPAETHIGMFDTETCARVVAAVNSLAVRA